MNNNEGIGNFREMVVGVDTKVPLMDGRLVPAINFDNAATTPPFVRVMKEVWDFAPWYSSIHRGTGYKSRYSSEVYERSRKTVMDFVNADSDYDTVIYVKNTTEAINKLSYRLCEGRKRCVVLSTDMEHHSNDLPWRNKYDVDYISIDSTGRLSLEDLEEKLKKYKGDVKLVTVTGASNVTGYLNPIYRVAEMAHRYNAKILVDGAQLVPHHRMDMKPHEVDEHIDFLAFSAHKMYAPFGIGVLVGPKCFFERGNPDYSGGGTVNVVTHDFVRWSEPPHKEEAGSPNIMGVVALAAAIDTIDALGMENIEEHERKLTEYAVLKLNNIWDIELYSGQETSGRVAIIPFNIKGVPNEVTAKILSYEAGISVRNGCFCAQPYIQKLLGVKHGEIMRYAEDASLPRPGMVRISFGLYNIYWEIDVLIKALEYICDNKKGYLKKYERLNE